jgi:hypothetical protein
MKRTIETWKLILPGGIVGTTSQTNAYISYRIFHPIISNRNQTQKKSFINMEKELNTSQLPTYQDAVPTSGKSLLTQLDIARSQQVQHTISTLIMPILEKRASRGLYKTTIALIPADAVISSGETQYSRSLSLNAFR